MMYNNTYTSIHLQTFYHGTDFDCQRDNCKIKNKRLNIIDLNVTFKSIKTKLIWILSVSDDPVDCAKKSKCSCSMKFE